MAFLLHQARFFTTVNHFRDLPATVTPEIAFAGCSNAGKSTAINVLCNQKRLAFASKTPGRTQHINYFSVGPADTPAGHLVDLPGYGYAEVPEAAKVRAPDQVEHRFRGKWNTDSGASGTPIPAMWNTDSGVVERTQEVGQRMGDTVER
jgi:ribosome biogenesis GTP-binding protein YsxC/EngB